MSAPSIWIYMFNYMLVLSIPSDRICLLKEPTLNDIIETTKHYFGKGKKFFIGLSGLGHHQLNPYGFKFIILILIKYMVLFIYITISSPKLLSYSLP